MMNERQQRVPVSTTGSMRFWFQRRSDESTEDESTEEESLPLALLKVQKNKHYSDEEDIIQQSNKEEVSEQLIFPSPSTVRRHVWITAVGAMWWYTYASVVIWNIPAYEYRGLEWPRWSLRTVAVFVWSSQVTCLWFVWKLAHAKSLREGQFWNLITDLTCVPADGLVVLLDPTGNKLTTVLGFAIATTFFGTMMVHHLREAAFREDLMNAATTMKKYGAIVVSTKNNEEEDHDHNHKKSILQTMLDYRPRRNFGSIYMAIRLSKAFVSFVVVLDATIEALGNKTSHGAEGHSSGGGGGGSNVWLYASLASVLVHTSMEVIFRTLLPGIDVHEHTSVLLLHLMLYMVHMIAASIVAHESFFGDTVWDNLVNTWLFASGSVGFVQTSMTLLEHVDMDHRFGLVSVFPPMHSL